MFELLSKFCGKGKIIDELKNEIVSSSISDAQFFHDVNLELGSKESNITTIALEIMYFFLHSLNRQTIGKESKNPQSLQKALYDPVAAKAIEEFSNHIAKATTSSTKDIVESITDELYEREIEYSKFPLLGEDSTGHNSVIHQVVMRIANDCCDNPRDSILQLTVEKFLLKRLEIFLPIWTLTMEKFL